MIKGYFENYFNKIKDTKKISAESGINWYIPLFNSFLITVVISFQLSNGVWYLLDSFNNQPWYLDNLWTLSSYSVTIFMTIITFTIQDKIIIAFIKFNSGKKKKSKYGKQGWYVPRIDPLGLTKQFKSGEGTDMTFKYWGTGNLQTKVGYF